MKNKISRIIENDSLTKIDESISALENELSFCINLPDDEKRGGFRLGDKNLGFLEKTKDYLDQKPDFMPSYLSKEEVIKDTTLAEQLTTVQRRLGILLDRINDTANIAGMEALSGSLAYYNAVKEAAKNNIEGAVTIYDDLRKRFPSTRKSSSAAE